MVGHYMEVGPTRAGPGSTLRANGQPPLGLALAKRAKHSSSRLTLAPTLDSLGPEAQWEEE